MSESMVILTSKDDTCFEVPRSVACMSKMIEDFFEDHDDDDEVSEVFPTNLSTFVLQKVVEFCRYYQEVEPMKAIVSPIQSECISDLVQPWYVDFCRVEQPLLYDLIAGANFLNIKPLLELTCLKVSLFLKTRSAAQIRQLFDMDSNLGELRRSRGARVTAATAEKTQEEPLGDGKV